MKTCLRLNVCTWVALIVAISGFATLPAFAQDAAPKPEKKSSGGGLFDAVPDPKTNPEAWKEFQKIQAEQKAKKDAENAEKDKQREKAKLEAQEKLKKMAEEKALKDKEAEKQREERRVKAVEELRQQAEQKAKPEPEPAEADAKDSSEHDAGKDKIIRRHGRTIRIHK
jgi:Skp family chaperone for outer membrane proteins